MTTDNKDNRLSIENCDYAEILRHAVIVMDYTYNLISIHIYLLILNSNHAANIHLLLFYLQTFLPKSANCYNYYLKPIYFLPLTICSKCSCPHSMT